MIQNLNLAKGGESHLDSRQPQKMEQKMIEKTLRSIALQLEAITSRGISLTRALDLLEASTNEVEEIMALNILRESLEEDGIRPEKKKKRVFSFSQPPLPRESLLGLV